MIIRLGGKELASSEEGYYKPGASVWMFNGRTITFVDTHAWVRRVAVQSGTLEKLHTVFFEGQLYTVLDMDCGEKIDEVLLVRHADTTVEEKLDA